MNDSGMLLSRGNITLLLNGCTSFLPVVIVLGMFWFQGKCLLQISEAVICRQAKAEVEEIKRRELAELQDKVEQMRITGELPVHEKERRGVGTKLKETLACHHGA